MAGQLTLALIKPHVVLQRNIGAIISEIENRGFAVVLAKMVQMHRGGAAQFYKEHAGKPFFENLINTMSSGPMWVLALAKPNAVEEWRKEIGTTSPAEAEEGTIRKMFGDPLNVTNNAVHGSATDHEARDEINFFFAREIKLASRLEDVDPDPII